MTRDEFTALPLSIALGIIYDTLENELEDVDAPKVPLPPKFDSKHSKRGQFCWMSEMTLEDLSYWFKRNDDGADSGGPYAEKNRKAADRLKYWVIWRTAFPHDSWRGKRGDDVVTAHPPSRDPEMHDWERSGDEPAPRKQTSFDSPSSFDAPSGNFGPDDDDIPF